jgi:hypothetical protein
MNNDEYLLLITLFNALNYYARAHNITTGNNIKHYCDWMKKVIEYKPNIKLKIKYHRLTANFKNKKKYKILVI